VKWPCFYGIDFASRAELIANGATIEEISQAIGADSLGYISEDGMIAATQQPRERLCTACFTGKYPIELPSADKLGKNLLERRETRAAEAEIAHDGDAAPEAASPERETVPIPEGEDGGHPGSTGCDPGPDSEFEPLLTDADKTPDAARRETV
jgi:amidophosphoribosyltransferase